jgi:hypothetical protein
MKKALATIAVIAAAAGLVAAPLDARSRMRGEERLAKLIEGRTAGEPQSCIFTPGHSNLTVIDKTALVYKSGGKVWVNRTMHPEDIDDSDILVIKRFSGSELCRQDQITLADRSTGMFSGVIFLSDFVPYEKAS